MNPIAIVHLLAAIVIIITAIPLIQRRVKMNDWYGVRIRASFVSEEAWFDINRYGGRLLLLLGISFAVTASVGAFLHKAYWITYNWAAVFIFMGGLGLVVAKILLYARKPPKKA